MASLETLFIEIDGNSSKASEGVNSLISSMRSLAKGVGTVVPALKALNSELSQLSRYTKVKIPDLTGATRGKTATASATKAVKANLDNFKATAAVLKEFKNVSPSQWQSWRYGPRPLPAMKSWQDENASIANQPHPYETLDHRIKLDPNAQAPAQSPITEAATAANAAVEGLQHVEPAITGVAQAANEATTAVEGTDQALQHVASTTTNAGQNIASAGSNGLGQFAHYLVDGASKLDLMKMKLTAMKNEFQTAVESGKLSGKQMLNQAMTIQRFTEQVAKEEERQAKSAATSSPLAQLNASAQAAQRVDFAKSLVEGSNSIDLMRMKLEAMKQAYYDAAGAGKLNNKQLAEQAMAIHRVSDELKKMEQEQNKASTATTRSASSAHKFGSSIARMAKSLLIRTALRALMKAFSEAWTAAYNYSHAMGGEFAQNVDKLRGAISGTAINLVTAFAPALNAIVPIVQVVASAIQYLCNLIKQLFSLLGMSSEFFGVSAESINNYSKAAGGGGSSTKGMLAAFDELNVIQSQGGGGGGGGAGAKGMTFVSDIVSDEMARLQMIVGESMIGIGLLLACTGHVPLGVAMIAIGAAAIVKTVVNDWGSLSQQTKDEIGKIMTYAAGAFLALGLILACFGHIGMGIALIAAGVANLVGVTAISGSLSKEVSKTLAEITKIAGGSLLALGVILCCFGHFPLGIGMIIAGVGSLVSSVALDYGGTEAYSIIGDWLSIIVSLFEVAWGKITSAINIAWNAVKQFFGSAAGKIQAAWSEAIRWLTKVWDGIKETVSNAWTAVSDWLANAYSAVSGAWSEALRWLSTTWDSLKSVVSNAWQYMVDNWFGPIYTLLSTAWSEAMRWLSNIWDGIKAPIKAAWDVVVAWFTPAKDAIENAWKAATDWLGGVWDSIKTPIENAWKAVQQWWQTNIGSKIDAAWSGVEQFFQPLEDIVSDIAGWISDILTHNVIDITINITRKITEVINTAKKMKTEGTTENDVSTVGKEVLRDSGWLGGLMAGALDVLGFANGGYDIPKGEIFVAQEAGAELIGEINGKTSVANQQQIIEGISSGVERANSEQNALLRQQNDLLRGILEKETTFRFGASSAFGRVAQQSLDMYANAVGGR